MPIDTDFSFAQRISRIPATAAGAAAALPHTDLLGLLRGFVGDRPADKAQRVWKGTGFNFEVSSITPFTIGSPDDGTTGLVPFDEEDLTKPSSSRTDLTRVASLTQPQLSNPNLFLSQAIAGQTITRTTVITVSSDTSTPGSVPDAGGGTDNIAFLIGKGTPPTGGPNANGVKVSAIFWIEQVTGADGYEFLQLQYTQRVLLDFNGLSWPHVSVATLRVA